MQALAHFTLGLSLALLIFTYVNRPPRQEFPLIIASGIWAILPDFWWPFREAGYPTLAAIGRSAHQSIFANVFWFHQILDQLETDRPRTEMAAMVAALMVSTIVYYRYNDWS